MADAEKSDWLERANKLRPTIRNWIGGKHQLPGGVALPKYGARDGRLLYELNQGTTADVDFAVEQARAAFSDGRWSRLPIDRKKSVIHRLADLLERNAAEFALLECLDVGKPISNALKQDVPGAINVVREAANGADKIASRLTVDGPAPNMVYQVRKPVGVVGAIVGWNFPLSLAVTKAVPALAMGNSVVLKPSEFTSLSAARLAELALEAGVPEGVFNVIHGSGATVGEALARHRDIGLLSFTGSSATGKKLMVSAGQSNMKRLMLECGGKSPFIVFEDCADDLDFVAQSAVQNAFANQGEVCAAGTRLLIHESLKERLLPKLVEHAGRLTPEDPLDPMTSFGALINEAHLLKVMAYIESGRSEGGCLVHAGRRLEPVKGGYYLEPSIFADVKTNFRIAREEIFGPVLSVFSFSSEEQALAIANDTAYGLAAVVCTTNLGRAQRLAQRLEASQLVVMGTSKPSPIGVFMGIEPQKESGFGREGGLDGLESYTTTNTVYVLV
jgi:acyl-CoA reductase-like NAD-dependent aldehyde dehydrogenase